MESARRCHSVPLLCGDSMDFKTRKIPVDPIDLKIYRLLENPKFLGWFGSSKVTDRNGLPMVMYHGTSADITEFDLSRAGRNFDGKWNWGLFFTNNNIHKSTETKMPGGGHKVLHDVASATYFAKVASEGRVSADNGGVSFSGVNIVPAYISLQNPYIVSGTGRDTVVEYFDKRSEQLRYAVEEGGHDGLIIRDFVQMIGEEPETLVVAMRPGQIKSAIGNCGSYNAETPRIDA
mgnify:FL=1